MSEMSELAQEVKEHADLGRWCEENLNRIGPTYECPCCSSGTHSDKSPAFTLYPNNRDAVRWKCFSCGNGGDIIDLYGYAKKVTDWKEKVQGVADWCGYDIDKHAFKPDAPRHRIVSRPKEPSRPYYEDDPAKYAEMRQKYASRLEQFKAFIGDARARACLEAHGLDVEAAKRHGLAFTPEYKVGRKTYPAVLIPYPGAPWYYTARILDPSAPAKYHRPKSELVGPTPIWDPKALDAKAPVVLVEGQFDAIAVDEAGQRAIALGTTGSRRLVEELRRREFCQPVIVMLDHDRAGGNGRMKLMDELKQAAKEGLPIHPYAFKWPDSAPKDAAEWLAQDPQGMRRELRHQVALARRRAVMGELSHDARTLGIADRMRARREVGELVKKGLIAEPGSINYLNGHIYTKEEREESEKRIIKRPKPSPRYADNVLRKVASREGRPDWDR